MYLSVRKKSTRLTVQTAIRFRLVLVGSLSPSPKNSFHFFLAAFGQHIASHPTTFVSPCFHKDSKQRVPCLPSSLHFYGSSVCDPHMSADSCTKSAARLCLRRPNALLQGKSVLHLWYTAHEVSMNSVHPPPLLLTFLIDTKCLTRSETEKARLEYTASMKWVMESTTGKLQVRGDGDEFTMQGSLDQGG